MRTNKAQCVQIGKEISGWRTNGRRAAEQRGVLGERGVGGSGHRATAEEVNWAWLCGPRFLQEMLKHEMSLVLGIVSFRLCTVINGVISLGCNYTL